jgi:hypothetical protein
MLQKQNEIIPEQQTGQSTNTESEVECNTIEEAKAFFRIVKERLLNVNNWHKIAGKATADFQLTDENGNAINRHAQSGDHFRIDIPGPGTQSGDGYDWVRIEVVDEEHNTNEECQIIRVRPATNPTNEKQDVAHFFSDEATSSFMVKRENNKVIAGVYGRNEKPNTHAESLVDKVRNTAVATGAITGFSKIQWKSLVNGLVKND